MTIIFPLSLREKEVLTYLSNGLSTKQIAKKMTVSENTVKSYTAHACRKLNAYNRAHAVAVAAREGIIK